MKFLTYLLSTAFVANLMSFSVNANADYADIATDLDNLDIATAGNRCQRKNAPYVMCIDVPDAKTTDNEGNSYRVCKLRFAPWKKVGTLLVIPGTSTQLMEVKSIGTLGKTPISYLFWIRESDGQLTSGTSERVNGYFPVRTDPICYTLSADKKKLLMSTGCQPNKQYSRFEVDSNGAVFAIDNGLRYRPYFNSKKVKYELCG